MKILFCGLGSIGQRHLRNLLKLQAEGILPQCEILAYRARGRQVTLTDNLTVEQGVNLEEKYPMKVFRELEQALCEQPDVVFITNPINMHYDTIKQVLDKTNADIFIEKPLTHTLDGIDELIKTAEKKKTVAFVGFQLRFHPCIRKAKELIDNGTIGDVIAANIEIGEYMPATRKYEDYRESTAVKSDLGGGVIIAQTHELDYACYFFGKPVDVYAVGGKLSNLEIDVEDTASILLRCKQDEREFPVHIHMDFLQSPTTRCCKIIGTEGKIEFDLVNPALVCYDQAGEAVVNDIYSDFVRNDMFIEELVRFFDIRSGKAEPLLDMQEGLMSVQVAVAAKKSLERGEICLL